MKPNTIIQGDSLIAYLAGIVDGEAYVGIRTSTYGMRTNHCKNPTYSERIQIKMQNKEIIYLFKKTFGGHIHQDKRIYQSKTGFKTNKPMWVYCATDKIAYEIAKNVYPYVIEKKKQIECLLKLRESKNSKIAKRRGSPAKRQMNPIVLEYRKNLCQTVKDLNHKKIVAIPEMPQEVEI